MTTAFSYHRVSSNAQETKEQVSDNRRYAEENNITVLNKYGEYGKRHHARKRVGAGLKTAVISGCWWAARDAWVGVAAGQAHGTALLGT